MAQGRKVFTAGEILQAADVQGFLQDQSVMVFSNAAARGSSITAPLAGMHTFRTDGTVTEVFNGLGYVSANSVGGTVAGSQVTGLISTGTIRTTNVLQAANTYINFLNVNILPADQNTQLLLSQTTQSCFIALTTSAAFQTNSRLEIINRNSAPHNVTINVGSGVFVAGADSGAGSQWRVKEFGTVTLICVSANSYRISGDYLLI